LQLVEQGIEEGMQPRQLAWSVTIC